MLDEDSDFYYVGRLSVSDFTNNRGIGSIKVDCDCDPYKYKKNATTVSNAVCCSLEFNLPNLRIRDVPTITSSSTMTIAFGNRTIQHNAGIFIIPTLELVKGNNTVTVTGTGNVSFTYQEGRL